MRYVEAGGVRLSAIGLGTWQFGSREWGYGPDYAGRTASELVRRALDLGINLIDTAEIYAWGSSERIVGHALGDRRNEAFLATKLVPAFPLAPVVVRRGRGSARRLGVETIDLYQVHWPNPLVPVRTTMRGMDRLRRDGVITHVGVSNFTAPAWRAAEAALGQPVLTNQVSYSLAVRRPEHAVIPHAQRAGRIVIAYSPLGQGLLSTRYDTTHRPTDAARSGNALFLPENVVRAQPLLNALREVAAGHSATPAQVALAWIIRRPNVVAIPGASGVEQLEANAAAADLELSDEEDALLTGASDGFEPSRGPAAMARLARRRLPGGRRH